MAAVARASQQTRESRHHTAVHSQQKGRGTTATCSCVSGKAKQEALSQSRFSSLSVWVWENESVGRMSVRKVLENAREEEAKTRRAEEGLELALNRIMKGEHGSEDGE